MKVTFVFPLLAVLASVSLGHALKCYVCSGSTSSDCAKSKFGSMSVQECPNGTLPGVPDSVKANVLCLEAVATDYKPQLVIRGCGVFPPNVDPCTFIKKLAPMRKCITCNSDVCNTNPLRGDDDAMESNDSSVEN